MGCLDTVVISPFKKNTPLIVTNNFIDYLKELMNVFLFNLSIHCIIYAFKSIVANLTN